MKKCILLISFLLSLTSIASEPLDSKVTLGEWINQELMTTKESLEKSENQQDNYIMELKTIRFRLRPSLALGIDFIAKAKIKPEIELYWTK